MKRIKSGRISLSRETLKNLSVDVMSRVRGGQKTDGMPGDYCTSSFDQHACISNMDLSGCITRCDQESCYC